MGIHSSAPHQIGLSVSVSSVTSVAGPVTDIFDGEPLGPLATAAAQKPSDSVSPLPVSLPPFRVHFSGPGSFAVDKPTAVPLVPVLHLPSLSFALSRIFARQSRSASLPHDPAH